MMMNFGHWRSEGRVRLSKAFILAINEIKFNFEHPVLGERCFVGSVM